MPGTVTWQPIQVTPKQPAAAETFNARYRDITAGVNFHMQGAVNYRHLDGEIDSAVLDDHATSVSLNPAQTDLHSRLLQLLTLIGDLADKNSTTNAFAAVTALTTDLKTLGASIGTATVNATPNAVMQRGANAEVALRYLTAYGSGVDTPEVRARGITNQVQPVVVVEDPTGATVMAGLYGNGLIYAASNIQARGLFVAGTSNKVITAADGSLLASALTGGVPAGVFGPLTGDVTTVGYAATVAFVGTKTASQVQLGVNAANAATSDATTLPNTILKTDGAGNLKVNTLTGALAGNAATASSAAQVPATGIQGTILASQIDVAIARTANVPTNAGLGATGTWGISVTGNAATATTAAAVAPNGITNAMIAAGAVNGASVLDYSLGRREIAEGAVTAQPVPNKTVIIQPVTKWNASGGLVQYGGSLAYDIASSIPTLGGQYVYLLLQVNSTGFLVPKLGLAVGGSFANATIPTADPDSTPLAVLSLQTGQGAIQQTDIIDVREFVSDFEGSGTGTGFSQIAHVHGQGQEVRVQSKGMDEGFVTATSPNPSTNVQVSPLHYRNTSGIVVYKPGQTIGPYADKPTTYERIDLIALDPTTGTISRTNGVENVSVPYPAASGNAVALAYLHMRPSMSVIRSTFDAVDGYLEDARAWLRAGGISNVPVVVADGGTGSQQFAQGLVWQASAVSTTAPLVALPTTTDTVHGLSLKPDVTGMSANATVDNIRLGNGSVTNGSTVLQRLIAVHAMTPNKGSGNAIDLVTLFADVASTGGTNYASAIFAGAVRVGGTAMPGAGNALDVTGNAAISGALATGALSPASLNVTPGNATVAGTTTLTGLLTANAGITSGGDITQTGKAVVGGVGQATNAPTSAVATIGGAALVLRDSAGAAGDGGYLGFGAGGAAHVFAGIKGFYANSTTNGTGDLVFGVHDLVTDTTLTEHFRIRNGAGQGASVTGALAVTGGLSVTGLLIQQGGLWGAGAFPTAPTVGETYYRADTHCWYWWDGANWNLMSTEAEFQVGMPGQTINTTTPTDITGTLWNPTFVGLGWCYCNIAVTILSNTGQCNLTWMVDGTAAGNAYLAGAGPVSLALGGFRQCGPGPHTFSIKASMSAAATSAIIYTGYGTYEFRK